MKVLLLACTLLLLATRGLLHAAAPTPAPAPAVEALAMLLQTADKLASYVEKGELASIHNDDMVVNVAVSTLLAENDKASDEKKETRKESLLEVGRAVSVLHEAGDAADYAKSGAELKNVFSALEKVKSFYAAGVLAAANEVAHRYTCPMHPDVIGPKHSLCPKCGMALDQIKRLLPFRPAASDLVPQRTVRASISIQGAVEVGQPLHATLNLRKLTGEPVLLTDLVEAHTQKIHLLIVDQSLTDYHHEHPQPGHAPGDYEFTFTPRKPGPYRAWADVRPNPTGFQEYAMTDIAARTTGEPLTDKAEKLTATVDGLHYELILSHPKLKVGEPMPAKLHLTQADGQPFKQLEPLMATFAHLVGFNEDGKTVLHLHPKGAPVKNPAARGGPDLDVQIYATVPGFYRLFAQVQIGGESKFAPFGITVAP